MKPERKLLRRIAALPAGEKLPLSRFAREFNCSTAVVVGMIQQLVADGDLHAQTLRPLPLEQAMPPVPPQFVGSAPHAGELLFDRVVAEGKRRGLSVMATSLAVFSHKARIYTLRDHEPRAPTVKRLEAWIADAPGGTKEGARPQEEGGPGSSPTSGSPTVDSPAALLADVDAYCARTGTPVGYIGRVAFNHPGFVPLLRKRGTLRTESAAAVRAAMERFPDGIAEKEALPPASRRAQSGRIEAIAPAAFDKTSDGGAERVTGEMLYCEVVAFAQTDSRSLLDLSAALFGDADPKWKLEQLRIAKRPRAITVAKVRALVAGEPIPERPPVETAPQQFVRRAEREAAGLQPSQREVRELETLDKVTRDRAKIDHLRDIGDTRREEHDRNLREVTLREAEERAARRHHAGRLTTARPLDVSDVLADAQMDRIDTASDRRARELDDLASPSSVLRRAQRDWPDQCVKVKALAAELGLTLAEAWHRVIGAGIECLNDPEAV